MSYKSNFVFITMTMTFFKKYKKQLDILFWVAFAFVVVWKVIIPRIPPSVDFEQLVFVDEEGKKYSLQNFKDKNLLINFYQSWCGPCMGEMPDLNNAYLKLMDDDFVFIVVSDESFQLINKVRNKGNYKMFFLQSEQDFDDVGIKAYPTTFLLNKEHKVVYKKVSPEDWDSPEMIQNFRAFTSVQ